MRKHWLLEREQAWSRLETLLRQSDADVRLLTPDDLREMGFLYRSVMNDLARMRVRPEYAHLMPYLNNLAQRCHGRVYQSPATRFADIWEFLLISFPQCFRRNAGFIFAAFLLFALGTLMALMTVKADPETATYFLPPQIIEELRSGTLWTDHKSAALSESSFLMTNNIRVAINAYAGGILFGIGALVLMFHNGMFAFGGPLAVTQMHGMDDELLQFVLPHGVIELTTIFIAGGAGMLIGYALLFPGNMPRWTAVRQRAWESMVLMMGCVPLLVLAGIIEGMISLNPAVGAPLRILISALSAIFLIIYLGFAGRGQTARSRD